MADSFLGRIRRLIGGPGDAGLAEFPLRVLIVGSFILPVSVFLVASWISYHRHFDEARELLRRSLGSVHEHAIKVFDTFEVSARYLEEITFNESDSDIAQDEAEFSLRIRNFISKLPQLRDLWVIGADGHPLVSGTVYPMPRNLDLSDRNYFKVQKETPGDLTYVSRVVDARAANTNFFAITRKRQGNDGKFTGVNLISIAPEYFVKYYATLPAAEQSITALMRGDGAILASYQTSPASPPVSIPPNSTIMNAIRANPAQGIAIGPTTLDQRERMFAYSKLPEHNVYVLMAIETKEIRRQWALTMGSHLIFGLPATTMMIALGFVALRRTRRVVEAHNELREEVARRQNTEVALRQAQKMEAVGRLTGGIAHDFNNLLTAILGNIDLAMRRTEDERIQRSLNAVRQASQRAATLVQRLLTFSRQHLQEVKAVDVNRLVQGMSELLHRTLGETITIETVLGSGLWQSALDPNQLENAILNLAVNARDAMGKGGRLSIETANAFIDEAYAATRAGGEIAAGQYVMIAVSDTGSGISPDIRDKIFEPFFTTKSAGLGSGLGLSMVYGFVKQSNGHVQIYSELDQGTTVKLYFPRLPSGSALPEWGGPDTGSGSTVQRDGGHESILLVEDDLDVANFVGDALRELGYRVTTCADAENALAVIRSPEAIDLLFTDVVLPGGMNGRELAEQAVELRPGLRVLYATGYTRNAIIHHGRLDPDVELLNKPFTIDALARKVREVLRNRPAATPR